MKKLDRKQMAARVARDIPEGAYVNLGIGLPTLVGDYLPKGREIILHSENGILGMGPAGELEDLDLINASKEQISLLPGASICCWTSPTRSNAASTVGFPPRLPGSKRAPTTASGSTMKSTCLIRHRPFSRTMCSVPAR